jgi:transposase-like protein
LFFLEQVLVLDNLDRGRKIAAVGRHYGVDESTIRFTWKIRARSGETFKASISASANVFG